MRRLITALIPLTVTACVQPGAPVPMVEAPPPPQPGLELVMGKDAPAVVALLGRPTLDRSEGPGRHLQFASDACVLDLYLYPPRPQRVGPAAPATAAAPQSAARTAVVNYAEARLPTGRGVEPQQCLASQLSQKPIG